MKKVVILAIGIILMIILLILQHIKPNNTMLPTVPEEVTNMSDSYIPPNTQVLQQVNLEPIKRVELVEKISERQVLLLESFLSEKGINATNITTIDNKNSLYYFELESPKIIAYADGRNGIYLQYGASSYLCISDLLWRENEVSSVAKQQVLDAFSKIYTSDTQILERGLAVP